MFGLKRKKKERIYGLITGELNNFEAVLASLNHLLSKGGHAAQADVIKKLMELLNGKNYGVFIKSINSVDMWGGSGAVWEVYFENEDNMRAFEKDVVTLIDLMEKVEIIGRGIKPIRKLFNQNSRRY